MHDLVKWMDRVAYPGFGDNWDDEALRREILAVIRPEHVVLDLGAGAGVVAQMNFKGRAAKVCGVDLDTRVMTNPYLDEAKIGAGEAIPYADATFDLIFSDNVLEHLADPATVLREACRVLKPGGLYLAKTPNRWHYMPVIAQLTPHKFHRFIKSLMGMTSEDTFPTLYRANTPAAIRRHASQTRLRVESIKLLEGRPEYLRMSFPTYVAGYCYERLVNLLPIQALRILLIVRLQKPTTT